MDKGHIFEDGFDFEALQDRRVIAARTRAREPVAISKPAQTAAAISKNFIGG